MNVLFLPKWDEANPYQNLLRVALEKKGARVSLSDYSTGILSVIPVLKKYNYNINVIHIHWISPISLKICWSKKASVFYLKCIVFILEILLCRLSGKKVVWTIHNRISHEAKSLDRELFLRKLLVKACSTIILHSEAAKSVIEEEYAISLHKKCLIIPHGNYFGCYPLSSKTKSELKEIYGYAERSKIILYFGAVKPYKGVEKIIEAANELTDLNFIVAGEVESPEYRRNLIEMSNSNNLTFDLSFLSNQAMIDYIEISDLILLPFNNTLTSGSVILSMTLGKGLILSHEAKVFGCIEEGGAFYFGNQNELFGLLRNIDNEQIKRAGLVNLEKSKRMSWQPIAELTKTAYKR